MISVYAMTLERPVLIRRIQWHGLAAFPHFYDLFTTESEQVHSRYTPITCVQHNVGVHGHQVAIAQHVLDCELLVRELGVILQHCLFQGRKTRGIEKIVVLALRVDVRLISFIDAACHDELQEFHGCLLVGVVVYHK